MRFYAGRTQFEYGGPHFRRFVQTDCGNYTETYVYYEFCWRKFVMGLEIRQ